MSRYRHFATALCPSRTFAAVAHHGAKGPPGSQKVLRQIAANIASDSSDAKHCASVRSIRRFVVRINDTRAWSMPSCVLSTFLMAVVNGTI
jgi:hypothetical protein